MRATQRIAQVVVEPPGAGVRPVDDRVQLLQTLRLARQLADRRESALQPFAIVQDLIDGVEVGPAADRDRLVPRYAQLHADTLKERLGQLEDSRAQMESAIGALTQRFAGIVERLDKALGTSARASQP